VDLLGGGKLMTEMDWLERTDPKGMLAFVRGRCSERKQRLFVCACARRVWRHIPDERSRRAIEVAEELAEGTASTWQVITARQGARAAAREAQDEVESLAALAQYAISVRYGERDDHPHIGTAEAAGLSTLAWCNHNRPHLLDAAALCALIRDIFGNPFRPILLDPARRTPTVVSLAQAAHDRRSLSESTLDPLRLAVLADALEDVGCTDPAILDHLRGPGPHVWGCSIVDLVLAKD
jgi:hypothetical protein